MAIPFVDLKTQYKNISKEIQKALNEVLETTNFILGSDQPGSFERNFAKACNVKHAVGCSNGTSALYLALKTFGIGIGDEVILPANTFIATAEAVSLAGATPVFVDVEEDTALLNVKNISAAITKKTKAIMPVHLFGQICDMDTILSLAKKRKLFVFEDCAQAHLAEYKGRTAGSFGDAAGFSFYPGKNLGAYGDAGATVTNVDDAAKAMFLLRNHGRKDKYDHSIVGFNFRLNAFQAAVLDVKLQYLKKWTLARRKLAANYQKSFRDIPGLRWMVERGHNKAVYHLFVVRCENRDALAEHLSKDGIASGVHYPTPLHLTGAYKHLKYKAGSLPVAEKLAKEILSLPIYPEMTTVQQRQVIKSLRGFFGRK